MTQPESPEAVFALIDELDPNAVREIIAGWPSFIWFADGRVLGTTMPDVTRDAWCGLHGVPHTERPDPLALLCEPFLDTEFTPADARRSGAALNALGFSNTDTEALRDRLREPMLSHNALWWEWVHLGYDDVLAAWPGSREEARAFCDGLLNRAWTHQGDVPTRPWTGSDPDRELSEVYALVAGSLDTSGWSARRDAIKVEIEAAYSEPWRRFHTRRHLAEAWALGRASLTMLRADAETRRQLAWTLLYHDVVYEPGRRDNEERSAIRCDDAMARMGETPAFREDVLHAIRWSARHDRGSANSTLLQAFFDADMGVLGLAPARYDEYAADVRSEYVGGGVTDDAFVRGRAAFVATTLAAFGDGPIYFGLDGVHDHLARANLRRSLP